MILAPGVYDQVNTIWIKSLASFLRLIINVSDYQGGVIGSGIWPSTYQAIQILPAF